MGREQLLPELLPTGEELVDKLRRGPQETDAAVITRALALMGALQKYVEDDALVVMEPGAPIEDDLVRLKLPDPPDVIVQHRMDEESAESAWRRKAISGLLRVFYVLNTAVFGFVILVWLGEMSFSRAPNLLSEKTLLALIGGSTAQLGALALFVGRSLVPARREGSRTADGEEG